MTDSSPPLVEIVGVVKQYGGDHPLRLQQLTVSAGARFTLFGFDPGAAEMFVHLVTGAALPDEGTVRVAGRDTREISTDTEWLASLDRFGLVTDRAVLIDALPIAANVALPLTLSIDPMTDEIRVAVESLGEEVRLSRTRLAEPTSTLTAAERVRVHLARALASRPHVLLLEHPTRNVTEPVARVDIGATLRALSEPRGLGWVALSDDRDFSRASGAIELTLNAATGELAGRGFWHRVLGGA